MIDWLTISVALGIIATLVGIFGIVAWKINMPDPLISANLTGKKDETNQLFDSDKKRKDKYGNDQTKKKRKDQKKSKRENKEEEQQEHHVKFKEPSTQTSEETDNEREESEHESATRQIETSSKVRKRKNKKAHQTTTGSSGHIEGILANKNEKSPVTTRPQQIPHPKLAVMTPKDEVELAKQHQQQGKNQGKSTQPSNKQTNAVLATAPVPVRKPISTHVDQGNQKQQQQQQKVQEQREQPFTTVGGNRHKTPTPPSQQPQPQQQQQQQNKTANVTPPITSTVPAPSVQQQVQVPVQHEQLPPRQTSRQQKEPQAQHNGFNTSSAPVKQSPVAATPAATVIAPPKKLADLVKALPTSQAVVTELMSALDAFPLSTNELDIIMHKIANKQSVLNQDWNKLQHGQKVDPQAHIGQVLNESARAYEADMKTNAMKHIKDLSDELNNDKRRINDLIKDINEKDINIQFLQAQLNASQHPQQQLQNYQLELKRLTEENMQLQQRLIQQQEQFQQQQQQQLASMNLVNNNNNNNNNNDSGNVQVRVISDQIKKLSVENGNFEKQLKAKELLVKELQKEKDELIRSNQQLLQKSQDSQKQFQHNEEKYLKELNETRTLNINQLNEYKRLIEQLELEKEQLRRSEFLQIEQAKTAAATFNNEEREKIEQLNQENEQYKKKLDELQAQYQSHENGLRKEIEQLKQIVEQRQQDENLKNELAAKNAQIDILQAELAETKATNDKVRIRNWKVMNELISAEEKLAAINQSNTNTQ